MEGFANSQRYLIRRRSAATFSSEEEDRKLLVFVLEGVLEEAAIEASGDFVTGGVEI